MGQRLRKCVVVVVNDYYSMIDIRVVVVCVVQQTAYY